MLDILCIVWGKKKYHNQNVATYNECTSKYFENLIEVKEFL